MAEFTKTETFLFLVLLLQVSEARDEFIIRAEDEVTFPCGNVTADQSNCNETTWLVRYIKSSGTTLVEGGKLRDKFKSQMRVSENCSLTVNRVKVLDVGGYRCERSGLGPYPQLDLSVVNLTEYRGDDDVTLKCYVNKFDRLIKHTVTWLFQGHPVPNNHPDFHLMSHDSDPSVTFKTSHFAFPSRFELFQCRVTDDTGQEHKFGFRTQSSDPKTTSTTTTTTTTKTTTTETASENGTTSKPGASADQWVYIAVVVVLVALLFIIVVVVVVACWKIKVNKKKRNDNVADAEVSYATVSFNNTNSTHVRGGDDAVTYTTVKASSADPSNLYATLE